MILWTIISLLAAFVAILLIRAALFKPVQKCPGAVAALQHLSASDRLVFAERFAEMLCCRTIHPERAGEDWSPDDYSEFVRFRDLLEKYYPLVHQQLKRELVMGHSLLYHWPGRSSDQPMVLMAHYDVVPAEAEQWSFPPFAGIIDNDKIWGRGSLDTKCTLFGALEAAEKHLAEGFIPAQDIYFAFGHDEETMGSGAPAIVELLKSRNIKPAAVLDEGGAIVTGVFPGGKKPIAAVGLSEKGLTDIEVVLEGSGGHASTPGRITPLAVLSKIILRLDKKPFPAFMPGEVKEMFNILGRHMPFGLKIVFANLWCFKPLLLAALPLIGRELNALCRTTSVFTMAEASKAANVIPDRVRAVANIRLSASDTCDSALDYLTEQARQASLSARQSDDPLKLSVKRIYGHNPSPSTSPDSEAYRKLARVVSSVFHDTLVTPYIMLGASDSRHFCAICDNVLRFSPVKMSREELRSIHGVNEYISIDQLQGVVDFYYNFIRES